MRSVAARRAPSLWRSAARALRACAADAMQAPALRADKDAARRAMRATLRSLPQEALQHESRAVAERLLASSHFTRSSRVGAYVSCERLREVDTHTVLHALFASGGRQCCFVPLVGEAQAQMSFLRIDGFADLKANKMGILEPAAVDSAGAMRETSTAEPLDFIIVPGVAFDARGRRLGRGGGYYDAYLRQNAADAAARGEPRALRVALAFEDQVVSQVPFASSADGGDELVDVVLTASRVLGPRAADWA